MVTGPLASLRWLGVSDLRAGVGRLSAAFILLRDVGRYSLVDSHVIVLWTFIFVGLSVWELAQIENYMG